MCAALLGRRSLLLWEFLSCALSACIRIRNAVCVAFLEKAVAQRPETSGSPLFQRNSGIMSDYGTSRAQPDVLPVLQTKEETKAFYNRIARVYDLLAERTEQPIRDMSFEKLIPKPGERILEIGVGTGHNLARIAKAVGLGGRAFGIDLAENMVVAARKTLEKAGCDDLVDLRCGDAEQLPYEAESMDAVIMNFTLELFDTPGIRRVLDEVHRVLRYEGRIVVAGISKEGKQDFTVHAFEWTHRHFPNLLDCRPIYISRALGDAGFLVVDVAIEHKWVPIEIVLAAKP